MSSIEAVFWFLWYLGIFLLTLAALGYLAERFEPELNRFVEKMEGRCEQVRQMTNEAEHFRLQVDKQEQPSGAGEWDGIEERFLLYRYCREHFFDDGSTGEKGYLRRWVEQLEAVDRGEFAELLFDFIQDTDKQDISRFEPAPFTENTPFFVQKWVAEGLDRRVVAYILSRPLCDIERALTVKLFPPQSDIVAAARRKAEQMEQMETEEIE